MLSKFIQKISKNAEYIALLAIIVSCLFVLFELLRFDTALWDHYAAFKMYVANYLDPNFSVLGSWIRALTTYNLVYRPTYNLIISLQYALWTDCFTAYYLMKWLVLIFSVVLMSRRLLLLNVSFLSILLFFAIVVAHPASPLLMLFSVDIYIIAFSILLLEISLLFFKSQTTFHIFICGQLAVIVSFLAGGIKEIAPVLMGLIIILAVLISGNIKRSFFRSFFLIIPLLPTAFSVLKTSQTTISQPKNISSIIGNVADGVMRSLPVGPSLWILLACGGLYFLYLYKSRLKGEIRTAKTITSIFFPVLAVASIGACAAGLPPWAHSVADRYLFTSIFFLAAGIAIVIDSLFFQLFNFAKIYARSALTLLLLIILAVGLSGQALQMNAYLTYFSHVNKTIKLISNLNIGEKTVLYEATPSEITFNISQIFMIYFNRYNLDKYDLKKILPEQEISTPAWVFSRDTNKTFNVKSYLFGQSIEKIVYAAPSTDRFLKYFSKLYLGYFPRRGDIGAPYLIGGDRLLLNHEFRFYGIKLGAQTNTTRLPLITNEHEHILEAGDVFFCQQKKGNKTLLRAEFIRKSKNVTGIVLQGKIQTDAPEHVHIGIRDKNGKNLGSRNIKNLSINERGEFIVYFDIDMLATTEIYEIFILSFQGECTIIVDKYAQLIPVISI